jgi:Mlc titration factor MtfA (ptsG expression regulator)
MLFQWLRERARERIRQAPFPDRWLAYLDANVTHYRALSVHEREVLQDDLRIFMAEKHWEGCGGLTLTDEIQVSIAAQACLLTLNLPQKYYPNVLSIFVYPSDYWARERHVDASGVVTEGASRRSGEAWHRGPVVLSWQEARAGGTNPGDGRNVVFHEFAHQLDMLDGTVDGVPRLHERGEYPRWSEVMRAEYRDLAAESRRRRPTLLDDYGAQDAGEFFAVATEAFFEKPVQMRQRHPRLYEVLSAFYRQDPADRVERHDEGEGVTG